MQTPEELLRGWGLTDRPWEFDSSIHSWRCEHPDRYGECSCFQELVQELVARDEAIRADERAKVLAGFEAEWGADLTSQPNMAGPLGPPRPTTEKEARQEHAVYQEWFDEGDAAWCNTYEKSTLVRRLVGPWEPVEEITQPKEQKP